MIDLLVRCLLVGSVYPYSRHRRSVDCGGWTDTVTNQAINAFTEIALPYIKQYIAQYRGQKQDRDAGKKTGMEMREISRSPEEGRFLKKVEQELGLIEYSSFNGKLEIHTSCCWIEVQAEIDCAHRLCGTYDAIRVYHHLVGRLAACAVVCFDQQLGRVERRCGQDLDASQETDRGEG